MRNPFARQLPGFRIEAGTDSAKNGKIDIACTTDKGQGLIIYENGNSNFVVNKTSSEVVGHKIADDKTPAKVIDAVNGDIHLRALNGTIILEAKNIRIIGVDGSEGEVTIQGSKIVKISGPNVEVQSSGAATIAAAQGVNIAGAYTDISASTQTTISSGVDAASSSLLGQVLAAIKKFKDFFKSICN
jgi:hypothetical protein